MESNISIYISSLAALIAFLSLVFAVKSWRESNRPIVTALIRCPVSGNLATALELVVSNSGNRPATDVRLHVSESELSDALTAPVGDKIRKAVERCFSPDTFIPVLEPGKEMTNSFGYFTTDKNPDTWKYKSVINVQVTYGGLTGRKYSNKNKLWIVCNKGFALSYHEKS
jgi:hypothetical protein